MEVFHVGGLPCCRPNAYENTSICCNVYERNCTRKEVLNSKLIHLFAICLGEDMVSQKHIRKDIPCLRFSAICSNVYEIHFEIKEVLIVNLYIYLQYLGGEDPPQTPPPFIEMPSCLWEHMLNPKDIRGGLPSWMSLLKHIFSTYEIMNSNGLIQDTHLNCYNIKFKYSLAV